MNLQCKLATSNINQSSLLFIIIQNENNGGVTFTYGAFPWGLVAFGYGRLSRLPRLIPTLCFGGSSHRPR